MSILLAVSLLAAGQTGDAIDCVMNTATRFIPSKEEAGTVADAAVAACSPEILQVRTEYLGRQLSAKNVDPLSASRAADDLITTMRRELRNRALVIIIEGRLKIGR